MHWISRWALPVLLGCGTAVAALGLGTQVRASVDAPVAAVFPPWWSASDAVAAAGAVGRIVRLGSVRFVVVVTSEGAVGQFGDIATRLRAAGAVLVVDPLVLGGCAPAPASWDRG